MKKIIVLLTVCLVFFSLGCASDTKENNAASKAETFDERVAKIVNSMTYKEKIGQMLLIGINGTELNDDSRYMLTQFHAGGVILFDRNLESAAQTKKLIADLNSAKDESVPLFIAIDEEGGSVVRGREFITPPKSAKAIGATGDLVSAESIAEATGNSLRELGFNVNFAPVADVGSSDRSFSQDSSKVIDFLRPTVQGYENAHIMYALKHFPGIGKGKIDSHNELSAINATREELADDLAPFKTMIDEREPENYMVLVSHYIYPAYDAENPASLSKAVCTDLLRSELGYRGIIITDDVEMGALAKNYSFRELGVKAILAGADIVMVCHDYEHEEEVYLGILDAIESGKISEDRLNKSVERIVRAKLLRGTRIE